MKLRKKRWIFMFALLGMLSLFVNANVVAKEKTVVEFWILNGERSMFEPVIADFEKENPDIEIRLSTRTSDGHKEALKVAAASGTLPNVWFNWGGTIGSFYPEHGLTLDLTPYAEDGNWYDLYRAAGLGLTEYDGKISGVPMKISAVGIYYRKDMFEELGIQMPTSFDEFENALATLKANGITPISLGGKYGWQTMRFTEAILEHYAGPELKDKLLALEESWDNPAVIQTYAKLKEWVDKGYFPLGFIVEEPNEAKIAVYMQQAAMVYEGAHFDTMVRADGFDPNMLGFFPFPSDHEPQRISTFVHQLQISKNAPTEVLDASVKFAVYATSKEVSERYPESYQWIVPAAGVEPPQEVPNIPALLDAVATGNFLITDQALPQELAPAFFEAQDNVVLGEFTPEQAAAFLQAAIEDYKASK